jgi:hypothetical protein
MSHQSHIPKSLLPHYGSLFQISANRSGLPLIQDVSELITVPCIDFRYRRAAEIGCVSKGWSKAGAASVVKVYRAQYVCYNDVQYAMSWLMGLASLSMHMVDL